MTKRQNVCHSEARGEDRKLSEGHGGQEADTKFCEELGSSKVRQVVQERGHRTPPEKPVAENCRQRSLNYGLL